MSSANGAERDLTEDCGDWPRVWASRVAAHRPDVALVMTGAWDVFDLRLDGRAVPFGSPEHDEYFLAKARQAVEVLAASGTRVALLEVACLRPVDRFNRKALPERGDDARTRHLTELLRRVAAEDAERVSLVRTVPQLCAERTGDRTLRWDGVHYTRAGASLVLGSVVPQLLAIAGRRG